jgi:hypothetical protein
MMPGVAVTDPHPAQTHTTHDAFDDDHQKEPSADWGWHGSFPRAGKAAGWFTAFALFAMLIGNHTSHVEDAYLIILGTLLVVMLIASHVKAHKQRRRWRD